MKPFFATLFACSAALAATEPLPVPEARRAPLDYERAFNAAHWQFAIPERVLDSVRVTLTLEGREVVSTSLTEQRARSSHPHIFDVVLSPVIPDKAQREWRLRIQLREHFAFTRIVPRPRIAGDIWEVQSPAIRVAPNRYDLGRFYSSTNPKKSQRLMLEINTNKE